MINDSNDVDLINLTQEYILDMKIKFIRNDIEANMVKIKKMEELKNDLSLKRHNKEKGK
ncbi:MAG TPA: hypothetical protein GX708_21830 [Gallicola sp.]|nr:hypothetical protein [Gallicola sp.]